MDTVSLTIRNVPARIMAQLRARARANHRSVQGEVLATFEEAIACRPLADCTYGGG
jgi:plasmid stability protein